jgi:uncharacterized integral membrane protein
MSIIIEPIEHITENGVSDSFGEKIIVEEKIKTNYNINGALFSFFFVFLIFLLLLIVYLLKSDDKIRLLEPHFPSWYLSNKDLIVGFFITFLFWGIGLTISASCGKIRTMRPIISFIICWFFILIWIFMFSFYEMWGGIALFGLIVILLLIWNIYELFIQNPIGAFLTLPLLFFVVYIIALSANFYYVCKGGTPME